jgi:hypothetical protein
MWVALAESQKMNLNKSLLYRQTDIGLLAIARSIADETNSHFADLGNC